MIRTTDQNFPPDAYRPLQSKHWLVGLWLAAAGRCSGEAADFGGLGLLLVLTSLDLCLMIHCTVLFISKERNSQQLHFTLWFTAVFNTLTFWFWLFVCWLDFKCVLLNEPNSWTTRRVHFKLLYQKFEGAENKPNSISKTVSLHLEIFVNIWEKSDNRKRFPLTNQLPVYVLKLCW